MNLPGVVVSEVSGGVRPLHMTLPLARRQAIGLGMAIDHLTARRSSAKDRSEPMRPIRIPWPGSAEQGLGDAAKSMLARLGVRPCGGCARRAAALNSMLVLSAAGPAGRSARRAPRWAHARAGRPLQASAGPSPEAAPASGTGNASRPRPRKSPMRRSSRNAAADGFSIPGSKSAPASALPRDAASACGSAGRGDGPWPDVRDRDDGRWFGRGR